MKLKFPHHFQQRLSERGINIDHVRSAVRNPDSKEDTFENRVRVRKVVGEREIEVIYYKDGFRDKKEEYIIVTAYYLDK